MSALACCPACGWSTPELEASGCCRRCALGWTFCVAHVRLEWARSAHARVTVHDVVRMVADPAKTMPDQGILIESDHQENGPGGRARAPEAVAQTNREEVRA